MSLPRGEVDRLERHDEGAATTGRGGMPRERSASSAWCAPDRLLVRVPHPVDERRYGVSHSHRPPHETSAGDTGPTVTAVLVDGPLEGTRIDVQVVEGRPPKTVDVPDENGPCRYCLEEWTQAGPSANFSFLYRV
jgi:hypothetical protein